MKAFLNRLIENLVESVRAYFEPFDTGFLVAVFVLLLLLGLLVLFVHKNYGNSEFEFGHDRWSHPALPRRRKYRKHHHHRRVSSLRQ